MPNRTIAAPTPWPELPTPNSSAAYATVWVNSVFVNAADIDASPTSTRIRRCLEVNVSDGDIHAGKRETGV